MVIEEVDNKRSDQPNKTLKQSNKIENVKSKKSDESERVKEKKQDAQKSPSKTEKKADKKAGKENVIEAKNKKNIVNSIEDKPIDFDDGEWETAFSRKDKKNRKKDDDILAVLTPEKTPKKKKEVENEKSNKTEEPAADIVDAKVNEEAAVQAKVEVPEDIVQAVLNTVKKAEEKEDADDQSGKKKKTKKSKTSAIEKADEENVPVIETKVKASDTEDKKSVKVSAVETGKSTPVNDSEQTGDSQAGSQQPASGAVFDELGDVWKEAPQKKSKKKVRKD